MGFFDNIQQIMQLKNQFSQNPNGILQNILSSNPNTQQFSNINFNGDAHSAVQRLLNSGSVNQEQLNQAIAQARSIYQMLGK